MTGGPTSTTRFCHCGHTFQAHQNRYGGNETRCQVGDCRCPGPSDDPRTADQYRQLLEPPTPVIGEYLPFDARRIGQQVSFLYAEHGVRRIYGVIERLDAETITHVRSRGGETFRLLPGGSLRLEAHPAEPSEPSPGEPLTGEPPTGEPPTAAPEPAAASAGDLSRPTGGPTGGPTGETSRQALTEPLTMEQVVIPEQVLLLDRDGGLRKFVIMRPLTPVLQLQGRIYTLLGTNGIYRIYHEQEVLTLDDLPLTEASAEVEAEAESSEPLPDDERRGIWLALERAITGEAAKASDPIFLVGVVPYGDATQEVHYRRNGEFGCRQARLRVERA